jgi:hypothetical protein
LERKRRGGSSGRREPNVKREIIEARGYRHLELAKEEFAEFPYRPTKCTRSYRVIALEKTIEVHEGQRLLVPEVRFHFYITNVRASVLSARQVIRESSDRCNQENLIEQTKNGVQPVCTHIELMVGKCVKRQVIHNQTMPTDVNDRANRVARAITSGAGADWRATGGRILPRTLD